VALNGALFVNAAILVMSAAVFFKRHVLVTEIQQAHQLLSPLVGTTAASVLFGAALLCSGQSSTLTGTLAGQIVMEGFLRFRMQPWLRRAVTRALAITPAALTVYIAGDVGTYKLIILSQVILSLQLPFAVIPLVHFTSDRTRMGAFVNGVWLRSFSWICAGFILLLNVWLLVTQISDWTTGHHDHRVFILVACGSAGLPFFALLATVTVWPWLNQRPRAHEPVVVRVADMPPVMPERNYAAILVPLDHSDADQEALGNALALARLHDSKIILLHVEEGVTSQIFGAQSSTAEITEGQEYLGKIADALRAKNVRVETIVCHGKRPASEIASAAAKVRPDLLIMAAHGHRGLKDLIFGTTINAVRHKVKIPLLIVNRSR
jgi:manganese transport protein